MPERSVWSINGVNLGRWRSQSGTLWRPPVSVRANLLTVPGRNGVINASPWPVFEEPQLSIELLLVGDDVELEVAQAELMGLLSAPDLIVVRESAGVAAYAAARLLSVTCTEFVPRSAARFQVALALPGVFLRGAGAGGYAPGAPGPGDYFDGDSPGAYWTGVPHASTSVWDPALSTVPLPEPSSMAELAALAGSTAPITDAVLRLTGPLTSVTVTDAVTGTGLSWSGSAVAAGTYLYLDAATLRAWKSPLGGQWAPGGTDASSGIDYPGPGPLRLWPAARDGDPADRRVQVTVATTGGGAGTALAVLAAPAYL